VRDNSSSQRIDDTLQAQMRQHGWVPQTSERLRAGWPERQDHTDVWGEGAMIAANSSGGRRLRLLIDTLVWYSQRP